MFIACKFVSLLMSTLSRPPPPNTIELLHICVFPNACYQPLYASLSLYPSISYPSFNSHCLSSPSTMSIGRFRSSTSTSFQLRNRSTRIERESPSQLVFEAAVQYEFLSKSRTEQNEFGIDNIGENKCAIQKQLPR